MEPKDVKILYKSIEILSKKLSEPPQEGFSGDKYNFDIIADTGVNPKEKLLLIRVEIKIREFGKDKVLGSIIVGNAFLLENFEEVVKIKDGVPQVPVDLDTLLKTMGVSTTRGIMFSEFRGTYLFNAILPIVFLPPAKPYVEREAKKEEEKV